MCTISSSVSACPRSWKSVKAKRAFRAPRTVATYGDRPFAWEEGAGNPAGAAKEALQPLAPFRISGSGLGSFGTRVLLSTWISPANWSSCTEPWPGSSGRPVSRWTEGPTHPHITLATRAHLPGQFARYQRELEGFARIDPSVRRHQPL